MKKYLYFFQLAVTVFLTVQFGLAEMAIARPINKPIPLGGGCQPFAVYWTAQCIRGGEYVVNLTAPGAKLPLSFSVSDGVNPSVNYSVTAPGVFSFNWINSGSSVQTLSLVLATDNNGCPGSPGPSLRIEPFNAAPIIANKGFCGSGAAIQTTFIAPGTGTTRWYNAQTGGTLLGTGNSFTTFPLKAKTSTFYFERDNLNSFKIGKNDTTRPGGLGDVFFNRPDSRQYMVFHATQTSIFDSVYLYPKLPGSLFIKLENNDTHEGYDSVSINITEFDTGSYYNLKTNWNLVAGISYRISVKGSASIARNVLGNSFYPITNNFFSIDSAATGLLDYFYFYRWGITAQSCTGQRGSVSVLISGPEVPVLTKSGSTSFCPGDSVTLSGPTGFRYRWNTGDTSQSITLKTDGNYFLRTLDANGCSSFPSDTVKVNTGSPFDLLPSAWQLNKSVNPGTSLNKTFWSGPGTGYYLDGAAMFKTTDNGNNWLPVTLPIPGSTLTDIAFPSVNYGWVATADNGFFQTKNGGQTWDIVSPGLKLVSVVAPDSNNIYFGIDVGGYYYSNDGGANWRTFNFPLQIPTTQISIPSKNVAYAIYEGGSIIKATDLANNTWVEIGLPGSSDSFHSLYFKTDQDGWVVGENASIWHTTNGGTNWSSVTVPGVSSGTQFNYVGFTGSQIGFILGTGNHVLKTIDGGKTWNADIAGIPGQTRTWNHITQNSSGYFFLTGDRSIEVSKPVVTVTASGTTFCPGDSIILTAPAGFGTYLWSDGGKGQQHTVKQPGSFTVQVGQGLGCLQPGSSPVTVSYKPAPAKPVILTTGSLQFCAGDSVVLNSNAPNSPRKWFFSDSPLPDTNASITLKRSVKVTLRILGAGCNSPLSDTVSVQLQPNPARPVITVKGSSTFCAGDSVVLKAPTGFNSYLWNNGKTSDSIIIRNNGNFTVTVGFVGSCASPVSDTIKVTVTPKAAKPVITFNRPLTFCSGDSTVLSGPATGPWLWSSGETSQTITVKNTKAYALLIPATANTCASALSDSVQVLVNSSPGKPIISLSGPDTICQGDSIILSGPSGYGIYQWSNGRSTQNITVGSNGSFTLQTGSGTCIGPVSDTIKITVTAKAAKPVITSSRPLTFCSGDSTILTGPATGPWLWSSGERRQSITVKNTGAYTLLIPAGINTCGSLVSDTTFVIVNTVPAKPAISHIGKDSLCNGDSVTLAGPAGYAGYQWSTGQNTQSIKVGKSGKYTLIVAGAGNCLSPLSDTAKIYSDSVGIATLNHTGLLTICQNAGIWLKAGNGQHFKWSNGATTDSILVSDTGTWSVQAVGHLGCLGKASAKFTLRKDSIPSQPVIAQSGNLCTNGSITLSVVNPKPGFVYYWNNGQSATSITTSTSGIFKVWTKSLIAGCTSDTSRADTVSAPTLPAKPVLNNSGYKTVCFGDSLTLQVTSAGKVIWNDLFTSKTRVVKQSGTWFVNALDSASGCKSAQADTIHFTVNPKLPTPVAGSPFPPRFCPGDSANLGFTATGNYIWHLSGQTKTQSNGNFKVGRPGRYKAWLTDANGCQSDSSAPIVVIQNAAFPKPVLSYNASTHQLTVVNINTNIYTWYRNNVVIPGQFRRSLFVDSTGNYSVSITATFDTCASSPNSDTIPIQRHTVGIAVNNTSAEIGLYPNPGQNGFYLHFASGNLAETTEWVVLLDALGRKMELPVVKTAENTVFCETSHLAQGIYSVGMPTTKGMTWQKWVKNQ